MRRLTTEEFIERAKEIHGESYAYSQTNYINNHTIIKIKCNRCGNEFEQLPINHLQGKGCPICAKEKLRKKFSLTAQEFIKKAIHIHKNKYDYSKIKYINANIPIKIGCNICHIYFLQKPSVHLQGCGCPKCSKNKKYTLDEFINTAKAIHGTEYKYLTLLKDTKHKLYVKILCKKCKNVFIQRTSHHLNGAGCPYCAKKASTLETFIKKAKQIHGNLYNYAEVQYKGVYNKIKIKCNKCKHSFLQTPANHTQGKGCPYCKQSKGELQIEKILVEANIEFKIQHRFEKCKDQKTLPFDFYLPNHNICIEYQGEQHYNYKLFLGLYKDKKRAHEAFKLQQKHDKIKRNFCKNNQIYLLEIKYNEKLETKLKKFLKIE